MTEVRWQDSLETEELRTSPVLDRYKSLDDALQGGIDTKARLSSSAPKLKDDATLEETMEWGSKYAPNMLIKPQFDTEDGAKATWAMLGVPADLEGYTSPEGADGLPVGLLDQMTSWHHEAGVTDESHQKILSAMLNASNTGNEQHKLAQETHIAERQKAWGAADEENMQITDSFVEKFQDPDNPLGELNNAARYFIMNMAKSIESEPQIFAQVSTPAVNKSPAEARVKLAEMRGSPIYHNEAGTFSKEERGAFLAKYNKLLAQAA